jgi:F-type H+-transporting ATPase subunit alpha
VGGKTQYPAFRQVAGTLRLAYAQFEELETFARFATRLDEQTRNTIERGRQVREVLKQTERQPLRAAAQIAVLKAVNAGVFDGIDMDQVSVLETRIQARVIAALPEMCKRIEVGEDLSPDDWLKLQEIARGTLETMAVALV